MTEKKNKKRFIGLIIIVGVISLTTYLSLNMECIQERTKNYQEIPNELHTLLGDVQSSEEYSYNSRDNLDQGLDCLNIFEYSIGIYYGVHHSYNGTSFNVHLVNSSDLINWNFMKILVREASMPYICFRESEQDIFIIHEQWQNLNSSGPCRVKIRYYPSLSYLKEGNSTLHFQAPKSFSDYEGTPNIYSIQEGGNFISIGFHFLSEEGRDLVANATLINFFSDNPGWSAIKWEDYYNKLICRGCSGNIGGRSFGILENYCITLQEGQLVKDDWSTWNVWVYNWEDGGFHQLDITTHQGSSSICNPHFKIVNHPSDSNKKVVFCSYFVPSEGAGHGELGELLFYSEI